MRIKACAVRETALPGAPGLFLAGAVFPTEAGPRSATGVATTLRGARARMDSERAEIVALVAGPETRMTKGGEFGVAAGPGRDLSLARAVLETVERVSVRLWWAGRGGALASAEVGAALADAAKTWKRGAGRSWRAVDISLCGLPPVFVVVSAAADGRELCFGAACRTSRVRAARAALKELCQMEFGLELAQRRRDRGLTLAPGEAALLERAKAMHVTDLPPLEDPAKPRSLGWQSCPTEQVPERLAEAGHRFDIRHLGRSSGDLNVVAAHWNTAPRRPAARPSGWDVYV